jgi:hypothetical protein
MNLQSNTAAIALTKYKKKFVSIHRNYPFYNSRLVSALYEQQGH